MAYVPVLLIFAVLQGASAADVLQVSAGTDHTCAIVSGVLKCFGYGGYGQLGSGKMWDTAEIGHIYEVDLGTGKTAKQVSLGMAHTCALLNDNSAKCFGDWICGIPESGDYVEDSQKIGDEPDEMGDNLAAVNLGTGRTAKQVSAGARNTCFVLDDDSLQCCEGRELRSVDLGLGKAAKQVSVSNHICAILSDDSLGCFGEATYGQLGSGGTEYAPSDNFSLVDLGTGKTAKQVSVGERHTCVILNDDSLKCWGEGDQGQLGQVAGEWPETRIGDEPGELGDNLAAVDLGTGKTAKQVAVGRKHTCVILNDDSLKCFGLGFSGQLGHGDITSLGGSDGMGDDLPEVDLGTDKTAKQVSAGGDYTCVVLNDDSLKCFGSGSYGKLGTGSNEDNVLSAGDALAAVGLDLASSSSRSAQERAFALCIACAACSLFW